jgi:hypothetical protein
VLVVPIVFVCIVIVCRSLITCALKARARSHAHWYALVFTVDNVARRFANEEAGNGVGGRCRCVVVVVVLVMLVLSVFVVELDVGLVVAL